MIDGLTDEPTHTKNSCAIKSVQIVDYLPILISITGYTDLTFYFYFFNHTAHFYDFLIL